MVDASRQLSTVQKNPLPGHKLTYVDKKHSKEQRFRYDEDAVSMRNFMEMNPKMLEQYVIDCIPLEVIKNWLIRKKKLVLKDELDDDLCDDIFKEKKIKQVQKKLLRDADNELETRHIIQFQKNSDKNPFSQWHLRLVITVSAWFGILLNRLHANFSSEKQNQLNNYLLNFHYNSFTDTFDLPLLPEYVETFITDKLIGAEKSIIYQVEEEDRVISSISNDKRIEFSLEEGIAGYVARKCELVRINNVLRDSRFDEKIDGHFTRNILAFPIKENDKVVAVIELINKRNFEGGFTSNDIETIQSIEAHLKLIINYSKLVDKLKMNAYTTKICEDVLSHHMWCGEDIQAAIKSKAILNPVKIPDNIDNHSFTFHDCENILPQLIIYMCQQLAGPNGFQLNKLVGFILSAKKSYRPVPFHNWKNACRTAHFVYTILKKIRGDVKLPIIQVKAIFIACLCLHIDHRGVNNDYLKSTNDPMSLIYKCSIIEQHHLKITYLLLQNSEINIFYDLNETDYEEVLKTIRLCILSTRQNNLVGVVNDIAALANLEEMNIENTTWKERIISLISSLSNLYYCCLPWEEHRIACDLLESEMNKEDELFKAANGRYDKLYREKDLINNHIELFANAILPGLKILVGLFPSLIEIYNEADKNYLGWIRIKEQNLSL
ncbi:DgyrCDS2483 [Dimorphilus gyrociliatus]|uniref:DgyrCDS2483 n=1 Tax=Dimorphilus gyrociliatus TaxID=2664684 RepID=A0A7I8VCD7_9ANNE|nr:DgyrCDS2483 [Dimorphilus gyrociliatus]